MAAEACAIVSDIRFEEQQTLWTKEYEDSLATETQDVFPGMMFTLARPKIEKSKLWKIVKKMPKGALLHCHLEAMVDLEWLIEEAFNLKGYHIKADAPLDSDNAQAVSPFMFKWLKDTPASSVSSTPIWSASYSPGTFIPIAAAADSFPHGGREGFKTWLRARTTITLEESLCHHHGPNDVWRKFQSCFGVISSLLHYEPTYREFLRRMFRDLVEDGVRYVDIRSTFVVPFYRQGSEEPEPDYESMLGCLEDEIEKFQQSDEGRTFWGARMIWTTIRAFDTRKVIESKSWSLKHLLIIRSNDTSRHAAVYIYERMLPRPYRRLRLCWTRGFWSPASRPRPGTLLVQESLRPSRPRHTILLPRGRDSRRR